MIYKKMPLHLTPFAPSRSAASTESYQATKVQINVRRNYDLNRGDEIRLADGRSFEIDTIEGTQGIFMKNQLVVIATEISPTVT